MRKLAKTNFVRLVKNTMLVNRTANNNVASTKFTTPKMLME